jgi:hypothetical protein
MQVRGFQGKNPPMNHKLIWIGILIVLAVTIVTVANCRQVPDPWVPQADPAPLPAPAELPAGG